MHSHRELEVSFQDHQKYFWFEVVGRNGGHVTAALCRARSVCRTMGSRANRGENHSRGVPLRGGGQHPVALQGVQDPHRAAPLHTALHPQGQSSPYTCCVRSDRAARGAFAWVLACAHAFGGTCGLTVGCVSVMVSGDCNLTRTF